MSARVRLVGGVNRGVRVFDDEDLLPPRWAELAACAEAETDLFFSAEHAKARDVLAVDGSGKGRRQHEAAVARILEAKAICAGCDVRALCLSYALRRNERLGIWGGLTTPERDELVRSRRAI